MSRPGRVRGTSGSSSEPESWGPLLDSAGPLFALTVCREEDGVYDQDQSYLQFSVLPGSVSLVASLVASLVVFLALGSQEILTFFLT